MSIWDSYKNFSGYNMLDSFLHPERGYKAAGEEVGKSWEEAKGYLTPYNTAGTNEIPRLQDATGRLLNPEELENQWASGYEESPYAKDELARANEYGLDAASAMGLGGSSAALENTQRTSSSIMNADRRNYLQDLIQKYIAGVQSSQNLFGTGAGVGTALGQGALQTGENRGQIAYNATNAPGNMFSKLLGAGASAVGTYATGMPMNFNANTTNNPNNYQPWQTPATGGY